MKPINFDGFLQTKTMPKLDLADITSAYRGKPNACMCGCSGTYFYTSINREFGSKERGYKVDDEDVNDATVKRIYNKMFKFVNDLAENGQKTENELEVLHSKSRHLPEDEMSYILTAIIGQTQYTIYTK